MTARQGLILLFCVVSVGYLLTNIATASEVPQSQPETVVAIFAGHTESSKFKGNHQGCISASGVTEFRYNDEVVNLIGLSEQNQLRYIIVPANSNIPFQHRPSLARKLGASAMIEIHHDSVQPQIYKILKSGKADRKMLDFYRGFSVHIYPMPENIELARHIENRLIAAGISYSEYHKENIPGESMKIVDGLKATYERTGLFVLKNSVIPTAIIECGCVANPEEDVLLNDKPYRRKLAEAINMALLDFESLKTSNGESKPREGVK